MRNEISAVPQQALDLHRHLVLDDLTHGIDTPTSLQLARQDVQLIDVIAPVMPQHVTERSAGSSKHPFQLVEHEHVHQHGTNAGDRISVQETSAAGLFFCQVCMHLCDVLGHRIGPLPLLRGQLGRVLCREQIGPLDRAIICIAADCHLRGFRCASQAYDAADASQPIQVFNREHRPDDGSESGAVDMRLFARGIQHHLCLDCDDEARLKRGEHDLRTSMGLIVLRSMYGR